MSMSTRHSSPPIAAERIVHVVDDDIDLRRSLNFLLATRHISVTSFASGTDFFDAVAGLPDAPIILDMRMPRMDGLQFLTELCRRGIDWPVIVLSGHGEVNVAVKAIKLGAIDFLEKPVTATELESCIEKAFLTLGAQQEREGARRGAVELISSLSPRETEVLDGLCQGQSNKQVAFNLAISPRTVEMHRANALRHLGVKSIAQVVKLRNATSIHRPSDLDQ